MEYYVNRKLTNEEIDAIYNNILNTGENNKIKKHTDYKLLFSKRYLRMSLLMMACFFLYSFSMYGINVSLPIILKYISNSQKHLEPKQKR